jgi:anti-sigma B factor antagonist
MTASPLDQPQFCVDIEPEQRLITVRGELDIDTAPLLHSAVDALVEQSGDVTIDLADLTFVDSAGLNEFVRIGVQQQIARHHLMLVGTSSEMRRTFTLGGLTRLLPAAS